MGLFKSFSIEGRKFDINKVSTDGDISIFDMQRYLKEHFKHVIIESVKIIALDAARYEVSVQWLEGKDRRWWKAFKNTCGIEY